MNIDSALEKIYSLKQFHIKLGLENITKLLNHIGNPQSNFKTFHVAGSNGKGSTCSFMASILQEHGFKVGLYTSPHLVKFNERIRINGKTISDDEIVSFLESNRKFIDEEKPTFFEIATAMAFDYFKKHKVDYAVIETGLGGRLDATNTIIPLASVITSISLEHTRILGSTIQKIAFEKAGIIKNKVSVFIGRIPPKARITIKKIAKSNKSELFDLRESIVFRDKKYKVALRSGVFEINLIALPGVHQKYNAALAIKTLDTILPNLELNKIERGLDNVLSNSGLQGRYERFSEIPSVIFDAAHNLEGIKGFVQEFKKEKSLYSECNLIYGALNDKSNRQMLKMLKPYFDNVFVTSIKNERAVTVKELVSIAKEVDIKVSVIDKPEKLIKKFIKETKDKKCLVVLGSIYLLGEIKTKLLKN